MIIHLLVLSSAELKRAVDELVASMQAKGYMVEGMHGDMSQIQRIKTLNKFKNGSLKFLVATDVAARGIDVDGVTHVFNYELPQDIESYVHRMVELVELDVKELLTA